jgi:hypothetical protein
MWLHLANLYTGIRIRNNYLHDKTYVGRRIWHQARPDARFASGSIGRFLSFLGTSGPVGQLFLRNVLFCLPEVLSTVKGKDYVISVM